MDKEKLQALIDDDDLGLLKIKPKASGVATSDERLAASFQEINDFIAEHGREPDLSSDIQERRLHNALKSIRKDKEKSAAFAEQDTHNLRAVEVKEITSIDDIFNDDDLGILDSDAESIFNLKHVQKNTRADAEYIAQRKPCKDFDKYSDLFIDVHDKLRKGERILRPFNDKGENLVAGSYYVLSGVLLYLESIDITSEETTIEGKRFRKDGRTRCIFENGTESNMLYRSLAKALYNDGRIVTEHKDRLLDGFYNVTNEDKETGFIYILRSLSTKPEIKSIDHLYKIGFSKVAVEERIKNASKEATYLMAPVSIVSAYQCFNLNPQKFEQLLHNFFGQACLNIDLYDNDGKRFTPREWFVAPIYAIEQAAKLLITGEIIHYEYNADNQEIIKRKGV